MMSITKDFSTPLRAQHICHYLYSDKCSHQNDLQYLVWWEMNWSLVIYRYQIIDLLMRYTLLTVLTHVLWLHQDPISSLSWSPNIKIIITIIVIITLIIDSLHHHLTLWICSNKILIKWCSPVVRHRCYVTSCLYVKYNKNINQQYCKLSWFKVTSSLI